MRRRLVETRNRREADAEELVRLSGVDDYEIEHSLIFLLGKHAEVELMESEDGNYFISDFNCNQSGMSNEEEADEAFYELKKIYTAVKYFKNKRRNNF